MKITVIIPALNEEKLLPATLERIKHLNRPPDEIVVVDGESTDKTVEIAKSSGARVVVGHRRTIGYARQVGLEAASGDAVAYTDADTLPPLNWLNQIETTLTKPGVSACYGDYRVYRTGSKGLFYIYFINYINPVICLIGSKFGLHLGGGQNIAFWKKKGIKAGGFPVNFRSVEDYEMLRRLSTVGKVIYLPRNYVTSSGRRSEEGTAMIIRVTKGMLKYFITGKADTFDFPAIR